jgi:hypothetical protein
MPIDATTAVFPEGRRRLIDEVAFLLAALSLEGPATLRPALLPCVSHLVRGRGHLLSFYPALLESLRAGLLSHSRALRMRATEAVSSLLMVSDDHPDTSTVARQLSALQPDLVNLIVREEAYAIATQALIALEAFSQAGVAIPVSALPQVLPECVVQEILRPEAGNATGGGEITQRIFVQFLLRHPQAFAACIPASLRRAADKLMRRGIGSWELLSRADGRPCPLAALLKASGEQLTEELLQPCAAVLWEELHEWKRQDSELDLCVQVAALLFCMVESIAIAGDFTFIELDKVKAPLCEEPTFGACVAALVSIAIHDLAARQALSTVSQDTAKMPRTSAARLALAFEELEELEAHERQARMLRASAAELMDERRSTMLHLFKCHWPELDTASFASSSSPMERQLPVDCCRIDASFPATDDAITSYPEPCNVGSEVSCRQPLAPAVEKRSVEVQTGQEVPSQSDLPHVVPVVADVQLPWFAEYDSSCDKWRCRLCAEAGGRNPYAKGIAIQRESVALRMRVHAGAAVHKAAAKERDRRSGGKELDESTTTRPCKSSNSAEMGCSLRRRNKTGTSCVDSDPSASPKKRRIRQPEANTEQERDELPSVTAATRTPLTKSKPGGHPANEFHRLRRAVVPEALKNHTSSFGGA